MRDALVFFSIIFAGLAGWFVFHREQMPRFRRKPLLTGSQAELFERLRAALPECVIAPGVAVSALIEPLGPAAARRSGRRSVEGQRVDFAVFDEALRLLAVVEVGHRARPTREEARRADYFAGAGVRALRLRADRPPSAIRLRAAVFGTAAKPRKALASAANDPLEYRPLRAPWRNTVNAHI